MDQAHLAGIGHLTRGIHPAEHTERIADVAAKR
jgi:hypothetical protein